MILIFRKVLDIDLIQNKYSTLPPKTKKDLIKMFFKIRQCPNFVYYTVKDSSFKGFHVELYCLIDCDICRMCYDDDRHFAYDLNRPEYARNILFDKKEKIKIEVNKHNKLTGKM